MLFSIAMSRTPESGVLGPPHPHGNVPFAVKHPPDVDVVVVLDEEHQVRESSRWPGSEARQAQFMSVARRTCRRMAGDMFVSAFQSFDESEGSPLAGLVEVMIDRFLYVPVCKTSWDDRLAGHPAVRRRTWSRRPSKKASSTADAGADAAPSRSEPRSRWRSWSLRISSRTYSLDVS